MILTKKNRQAMLFTLVGLSAQAIQAGGELNENELIVNPASAFPPFVFTLSVGPVWENAGKSQTFYLAPDIEKTYDADNATKTLLNAEIFLGLERVLSEQFYGQLGIALAAASPARLSGDIWDDADPQFNNFSYDYKINHLYLGLKGKILAQIDFVVTPWISASAGFGFNDAYHFSNKPTIYEAIVNPDFSSHTQTTFSYTLGAGIQRAITENWEIGIGYEFADWGKSKLGRAPHQTQHSGLALDHLYTNGLLLNITYLQ